MWQNMILIGTGGFFGSVLRYGTNEMVLKLIETNKPLGTFAVNVVGSFIIGIVLGLFENGTLISANWKLFLAVGFCGGFTTFSSFALENLSMMQAQQFFTSILYIVISIFVGLLAVYSGFWIVK